MRRGFSASGGAETYLKRFAEAATAAGHTVQLLTTQPWPGWTPGEFIVLDGRTPTRFADAVEKVRQSARCDVLFSLERIWECDVFRAGDGVHRAWLERRRLYYSRWRSLAATLNAKHRALLRLEESLFGSQRAGRVIANSQMVRQEIVRTYDYPEERIELVYNGVPIRYFEYSADLRETARRSFGLAPADVVLLFVGSGWERKGLRFALEAVERINSPRVHLFVAGKDRQKWRAAPQVRFLGEVQDLPALYAMADLFILPTIYDPFSNACLEAFASGLPVITTRANGFSEIMEGDVHGTVLEDPADSQQIERAISGWLYRGRREQARAAILKRAAEFDISRNVARTLEVLAAPPAAT